MRLPDADAAALVFGLGRSLSSSRAGLPRTLVGVCNEKNLALLEDFFADRDELFQSSLDREVENLQACIDSREHNGGALMEFLAQYDD